MTDRNILDEFDGLVGSDDIFDSLEEFEDESDKEVESEVVSEYVQQEEAADELDGEGTEGIYDGYDNDQMENKITSYLIIDRPVHGLVTYFKDCGVNITNMFTSIVDARNAVLIQSNPCRIILADTGLGRFTTTQTRKAFIDMIGICDEKHKVSVFYTDSVLMTDSMKELGESKAGIGWYKYEGTAAMVAQILQYKEEYELGNRVSQLDKTDSEKLLKFKGLSSSEEFGESIDVNWINSENIIRNILETEDESLPKFEVRI